MIQSKYKIVASAEELINTLIDSQAQHKNPFADDIIWRGVGDFDGHKLVPSVFRRGALARMSVLNGYDTEKEIDKYGHLGHMSAELSMVQRFVSIADRSGLALPEITPTARDALRRYESFSSDGYKIQRRILERDVDLFSDWPSPDLIPLFSLLQHYGIPTRLLDWSYKPLTAAYFAATSAITERNAIAQNQWKTRHLAIWVLSLDGLNELDFNNAAFAFSIQFGSPPSHQNPNLGAQSGAFTWFNSSSQYPLDDLKKPLDEIILRIMSGSENSSHADPPIDCFLLNWQHADDLLLKLYNLGVSKATITPGYAGVAECMQEIGAAQNRMLSK